MAWKKICRPKKQGCLGVLNINIQNKALLLRNLQKFYNNHGIPWVKLVWEYYYSNGHIPGQHTEGSFWWKAHLKLIDTYKATTRCKLGNGKSAYFWTDLWGEACLHNSMLHLVSYAKKTALTVHEILNEDSLEDQFHLPLSQQAYSEFLQLEGICQEARQTIQAGTLGHTFGAMTTSLSKKHIM